MKPDEERQRRILEKHYESILGGRKMTKAEVAEEIASLIRQRDAKFSNLPFLPEWFLAAELGLV